MLYNSIGYHINIINKGYKKLYIYSRSYHRTTATACCFLDRGWQL